MTQTLLASLFGKIVAPPKKSRRNRGAQALECNRTGHYV